MKLLEWAKPAEEPAWLAEVREVLRAEKALREERLDRLAERAAAIVLCRHQRERGDQD